VTDSTLHPCSSTGDDPAALCHVILIDFLAALDHGHAIALNLFTHDASLDARGEQLHGRHAICGFLTERETQTKRPIGVLCRSPAVWAWPQRRRRPPDTGETMILAAPTRSSSA
jgi:hypothetical protein